MLRENNIVKFVRKSNVLRPGYYLGLDMQKKLVILCIRGTQNVYDLITNIISSGHEEVTFEGYSAHFGTAEAARWFLTHEIDSIRMCLNNHKVALWYLFYILYFWVCVNSSMWVSLVILIN